MKYHPPRWLPGGHAQTIWPVTLPVHAPPYRRERWETPDGDFIDLDWIDPAPVTAADVTAASGPRGSIPTVVLFHGLEGSSRSPYARELMRAVHARGWRGVVPHYRGCSGEPNRLPRFYHSADSAEVDWILRRLAGAQMSPMLAVGVSLGGNLLLKWLGEQAGRAVGILAAAATVCAPHDLSGVSRHLERGFNRIYTRNFLRSLIPRALIKAQHFPGLLDAGQIRRARTLREYDEVVTAPVHGFRDAADYYAHADAKALLRAIAVPTLVLNAANDPFVPPDFLPRPGQLSKQARLEVQPHGGHLGFVDGRPPGHLNWLPRRLLQWFDTCLATGRSAA